MTPQFEIKRILCLANRVERENMVQMILCYNLSEGGVCHGKYQQKR